MNRQIPRIGAAIVCVTVFLFAVCLIADFSSGAYFVCMLLPLGYIMTAAGFQREAEEDRKVAANVGLVFSAVYATLILLVDFRRGGLLFNYDLLGYGMMALSTFFLGLSMRAKNRSDRWLKRLLMLHGAFFVSCFILPMTGMFAGMAVGGTSHGGATALVIWCAYFLPVGLLAWRHFGPDNHPKGD